MTSVARKPVVAVLGASGLIGEALCSFLMSRDYDVVPMARLSNGVGTGPLIGFQKGPLYGWRLRNGLVIAQPQAER